PIGKLVASAQRVLGMLRTQVFLRQRAGRDVEAFPLGVPVVILGGDCRDDAPETRYLLGVGLLAAHPSNVLLLGQPEPQDPAASGATLGEWGELELVRGRGPTELADVASTHATIADLVRLATSPEFAEARWRHPQSGQRRRTPSGSAPQSNR